MKRRQLGGSMVGTLIAIVIVVLAVIFYFNGRFGIVEEGEAREDGVG